MFAGNETKETWFNIILQNKNLNEKIKKLEHLYVLKLL